MRTQIAKSLQKRCKAIRTAVNQYNAAAAALDRPALDWSKVSQFGFLEEFTLLQDTRNDIRNKKWAQPLIRETMRTSRRVICAEYELINMNREARRVHTSIRDEDILFTEVLAEMKRNNDPWYGAVLQHCERRRAINAHLLAYLLRIYALEGFTGIPGPGVHAGPARERPRAPLSSTSNDNPIEPDDPSHTSRPSSPMNVDAASHPPGHLDNLAAKELSEVESDEREEAVGVEEDDEGAVTDVLEHVSNIAAVM